jgi:hypothetical protein
VKKGFSAAAFGGLPPKSRGRQARTFGVYFARTRNGRQTCHALV